MSTASDAGREIQVEPGWKAELEPEFRSDYMAGLRQYLLQRKRAGATIYPPGPEIFAAFNNTPFDQVKVVILGQDPYHGPGQAHGLCFSVRPGVRVPPSLVNMYKELRDDVGFEIPDHGYLLPWARQGVLLLNAVLTVERGQAASHRGKGWEAFTDRAVQCLNEDRDGLVFLLWGSAAQKKGAVIDRRRHLVLTASHPSPLSANRGFFGCRHFSRANDYLQQQGREPIDWQLPQRAPAEPER